MRAKRSTILGALASLSLIACPEVFPEEPARPPNVVLILIDTLRADLLGCYGNSAQASPELDAFAENGILFEQAIAQCSWTRPSIGALLTSKYPRTLGLYKERDEILDDRFVTLAEYLKAQGYATLGVTANPVINSVFNMHQGFDAYLDSSTIFSWMKPYADKSHKPILRRNGTLSPAPEVFDSVFRLLDAQPRGPHYIQINLMEIHEGWRWRHSLTREPYDALYPTEPHRKYLQALRQVSSDIGEFAARLRTRPGFEDTLFIFTSDHGQGIDNHPHVPFSSFHGRIVYESQVMVPLILYRPGSDLEPRRVANPVRLIDVLPTLLDYLAQPLPEGFDGVSLLPLMRGAPTAPGLPDAIVVETAYRDYWKIGLYAPPWKYIENRDGHHRLEPFELQPWGIHEDGPRTDQSAQHPDVVKRLRAELHQWEAAHPRIAPTPMEAGMDPEAVEQLKAIGYGDH